MEFKVGDVVIVIKSALEWEYPEGRLGVNIISEICEEGVTSFEGHPYVCSTVHIRPLTKLDRALA